MNGAVTRGLATLNGLQRDSTAHVLLYHATFSEVPRDIRVNLHNVAPDVLHAQLKWLQSHFDFVFVDELFDERTDDVGTVAITFDDAYQSVLDEALPVIEALGVPATIFVNGAALTGRPFWRDKVRYLINHSLVGDFVDYCSDFATSHGITSSNFYRTTKAPHVNSAVLGSILDEYLESLALLPGAVRYCVGDTGQLVEHALVRYGNHSLSHYVLSSLSRAQQEHEISENHRILTKLPLRLSKVFSVPFGGDTDLNRTTVQVLKSLGYVGFLYSRGALNHGQRGGKQSFHGLPYRERYMVPASFAGFQRKILRLWVKGSRQCGL